VAGHIVHPQRLPSDQIKGPLDCNIYIDASTSWGIGLIFTQQWDAWKLKPNWKGPCRDIEWLEGVALKLLIYLLNLLNLQNTHLIIFSDNQGVITAFDKGAVETSKLTFPSVALPPSSLLAILLFL
jgi:hypothetical protein